MVDPATAFASLLIDRMEERDLTTASLAETLDVPTEVVEAWQHAESVPDDHDLVPVASALSLPRSLVREAIRRADEAFLEIESEEFSRQSDEAATLEHPAFPDGTAEGQNEVGDPGSIHIADPTSAVAEPADRSAYETPMVDLRSRTFEALTTPWMLLRDRLDRRRATARAPTRELSYIEDTHQRLTYRLRGVFTAGGILAMIIILRWALSGFGESLGSLWETLTSVF